jgi:hypothetical protein
MADVLLKVKKDSNLLLDGQGDWFLWNHRNQLLKIGGLFVNFCDFVFL